MLKYALCFWLLFQTSFQKDVENEKGMKNNGTCLPPTQFRK